MHFAFWWVSTVLWAWLIWILTTTAQPPFLGDSFWQHLLAMCGHFFFFGFLALLLYRATLSLVRLHPLLPVTLAILLTSFYGAFIEFVQLSVPGRSADPLDWLLDTLGALTFLFFVQKLQSAS